MRFINWLSRIFTDKHGTPSSMRIVLVLMGFTVWLMLDEVRHYIRVAANTTATVDWIGISTYLGAMTTLIGIVIFGKVKQTKIESDDRHES